MTLSLAKHKTYAGFPYHSDKLLYFEKVQMQDKTKFEIFTGFPTLPEMANVCSGRKKTHMLTLNLPKKIKFPPDSSSYAP